MRVAHIVSPRQLRLQIWRALNVVVAAVTIANVSLVGAFVPIRGANAATQPTLPSVTANPTLGQTCGLDIGLVIDRSGSMSNDDMAKMKTALQNFTGSFSGTPTVFSLTSFASSSTLNNPFSLNPLQATQALTNFNPVLDETETTNWESGLARSFSSFDPRPSNSNLIVIATDGSPNRFGYPTTNSASWNYDNTALAPAMTQANTIKTAGTRIVVIGIGDDPQDFLSTSEQKIQKMTDISGLNVATDPTDITVNTDVIKVTNFDGIGAALASFATVLCPGSIRVNKQVDSDFDNVYEGDNTAANQLGFSWTLNGGANLAMGSTESAAPGNHTVTEMAAPGYAFTGWYASNQDASCSDPRTLNGTTLPITVTVNPLQNTEITLCNRLVPAATLTVNKQFDDNGDGTVDRTNPAGWTWDLKNGAQDNAGGASLTVTPGTLTVSEDAIAGYTSTWSCTNSTTGNGTSLDVPIAHAQSIVCTFKNTKLVSTISLDKQGPAQVNAGEQIAYTLVWTVSGNTGVTNAVVTDTLPANTNFVSASNGGTVVGGTVVWNLGSQATGATGSLTLVLQTPANVTDGMTLKNTGTFDTDQTDPQSDSVNTTIKSTPPIVPQVVPTPQVLGAETHPELTITKSVDGSVAHPGDILTYTIKVKNTGDGSAENVVVTDTLPKGLSFTEGTGRTKSWALGTLVPGKTTVISVDVRIDAKTGRGDYINTAKVVADNADPKQASATIKVTVPKVLGLATTGAGRLDYVIFSFGALLAILGIIGLNDRKLKGLVAKK